MELFKDNGRWWVNSSYHERLVPKGAGFQWSHREMPQRWSTSSIDKAIKLKQFASGAVLTELDEYEDESKVALIQSRALGTEEGIDFHNIPAPEGKEYFAFQRAAIQYAAGRKATLFGDEMGLGKTIQAIGVLNMQKKLGDVLIVCPASLRLNWWNELRQWLVHPQDIGVVNGSYFPFSRIVIINYDVLARHMNRLRERQWQVMILDEIHYLKNPKAQRTQAVFGKWASDPAKRIAPIQAEIKMGLSGTPIPNRPIELFSIINGLLPGEWGTRLQFAKRYCNAYQGAYGWDMNGASNLDELQTLLRMKLMIRRRKAEVLKDLPPKQRQIIEMPSTNEIKKMLAEELQEFESLNAELDHLRRLMREAERLDDQESYRDAVDKLKAGEQVMFAQMSKRRRITAMAKAPYVVSALREILEEKDKLVVMAHHKEVVAMIRQEFGSEAVTLVGDTSMGDRQVAVDRFQTDPTVKLFIGSIQAAGVGITLTAADHMVFAELDWVPGNMSQAEDRLHRIGQHNHVLIQHFVLEGSLDARMARTLVEKQEVLDASLDKKHEVNISRMMVGDEDTAREIILQAADRAKAEDAARLAAKARFEALKKKRQDEMQLVDIDPEQVQAVHQGLRILAGMCDGARAKDDCGFNAMDANFGHQLAHQGGLSVKQALAARKMLRKYHRQIGNELLVAMGSNPVT